MKKKELLAKEGLQSNENTIRKSSNPNNDYEPYTCASKITIAHKSLKRLSNRSSATKNKSKTTESVENSTLSPIALPSFELGDKDKEDDSDAAEGSIEYSLSSTTRKSSLNNSTNTTFNNGMNLTFDDVMDTSCNIDDNSQNNIYIEKIKDLTLKIHQQAKALRQKHIEINRLRSSTIGNA